MNVMIWNCDTNDNKNNMDKKKWKRSRKDSIFNIDDRIIQITYIHSTFINLELIFFLFYWLFNDNSRIENPNTMTHIYKKRCNGITQFIIDIIIVIDNTTYDLVIVVITIIILKNGHIYNWGQQQRYTSMISHHFQIV